MTYLSESLAPDAGRTALELVRELATHLEGARDLSDLLKSLPDDSEGSLLTSVTERVLATRPPGHELSWRLKSAIRRLRERAAPIPAIAHVATRALRECELSPLDDLVHLLTCGLYEPGILDIDEETVSEIVDSALGLSSSTPQGG